VWWTEVYTTKYGAENAIRVLRDGAYSARVFDRA
jgi:uncharacterized protein YegP (UPF0339 family)